ncbi:serine hydrolase [Emticicia sp. ODNR4P]|jgi:CubicO group peptidase (beta-lactamase class C family)|nr:serine hydrolase [Emticicia sp. ODNR4P]
MKKLLFFYLFLFTITAFAQKPQQFTSGVAPEKVGMSTERLNRIEQLLNRKIAEKRIPGAVVLAARHGQLVLHKAYGMNDIETKKLKKRMIFFVSCL